MYDLDLSQTAIKPYADDAGLDSDGVDVAFAFVGDLLCDLRGRGGITWGERCWLDDVCNYLDDLRLKAGWKYDREAAMKQENSTL